MATFTHETPYGNAPSIQYNAAVTYNNAFTTYNGKSVTVFTHEQKSP